MRPASFYARDALDVARDLLGMVLVRDEVSVRITEVEAYRGPKDTACHARSGRTHRNAAMWGPPGRAYVYLCYGLHHMLNVVTGPEGYGAAVLVRAAEPVHGLARIRERRGARSGPILLNGPGKLAAALGLDLTWSHHDLTQPGGLELHPGHPPTHILTGPRVGIDYAQPADRDAPWRLAAAGTRWVSKRASLAMLLVALSSGARAADEEVTVWGEHAVQSARADIVREMEDMGWRARERRGLVVFRPPQSWMGRARLDDEGDLTFGKPVLAFGRAQLRQPGATLEENPNLSNAPEGLQIQTDDGYGYTAPVPESSWWILPSLRVLEPMRARVRARVDDEIETYKEICRETSLQQGMLDLRDDLDALWSDGTPLRGDDVLDTPAARRGAILAYWSTRRDTPEGDLFSEVVEKWLRRVVQDSAHPVTEEERSAAESAREDGRKLPLD